MVVTDATRYAGRVDTNLRDWLANVWLILALMFTIPGVFRRFISGLDRFNLPGTGRIRQAWLREPEIAALLMTVLITLIFIFRF